MDPVTGALQWPGALQRAEYQPLRSAVEEYAAKWARYGELDGADQKQIRENITAMLDGLKSRISELPPQDYVASRSFLQSLLYTTTRSVI